MSSRHEAALAFSPRRVSAMMLRYWYLLRSSWPRLLDLVYWPTVQMVTWGFLQYYIANNAGFFARAGGTFIGAVLLWIALPQVLIVLPLAVLLRRVNARWVLALGTILIGIACLMATNLTSQWATEDFLPSQVLQAIGQSFALTALDRKSVV